MVLKVNFVSFSGPALASHRMRVLEPANILNCCVKNLEVEVTDSIKENNGDVFVFFKHFNQDQVLNFCNNTSKTIIFDICDNHFNKEHKDFYLQMLEKASVITCNTNRMKSVIASRTDKPVIVIPDPITFPDHSFESSSDSLKFIWFGHGSNVKPLIDWLNVIPLERITVVCNTPVFHPKVEFVPWRPGQVERMIKHFDVVLIPTTKEPWTDTKSPNRAVDALNAGKLVITDNSKIYGELKDYVEIISDPSEITDIVYRYADNSKHFQTKIEKGQEYVRKTYGSQNILDGWMEALKETGLVKEVKNVS